MQSSIWCPDYGDSLTLLRNVVHIWRVNLSQLKEKKEKFIQYLTVSEQNDARRFVRQQDAERYVLSRAIQRLVLSRYLCINPMEIRFTVGAHGKPFLLENQDVQFNISHSGDCFLLAVTLNVSIGVDVENIRRPIDSLAIAKRFFTTREYCDMLQFKKQEKRQEVFYRCWVLKEAFIKATGRGLSFPLSEFEVEFIEKDFFQNCLASIQNNALEAKRWLLCSLDMSNFSDDYCAAIAIEESSCRFILKEWVAT